MIYLTADTLLTWQKSNLFSPWYTWHPAHLAKKLYLFSPKVTYLMTPCSPGKKVTYSDHDIPDNCSPGKKVTYSAMIYLTPCSPGKKVTYSHHDIPDTLLTWQKSYLFSPWYTWLNCSPGKKVTYSDHDIPDTLLTWQKSNLFWPWYTWHPAHLAKK